MAQQLNMLAGLSEDLSSACASGGSQLPVPPAPGGPTPSMDTPTVVTYTSSENLLKFHLMGLESWLRG